MISLNIKKYNFFFNANKKMFRISCAEQSEIDSENKNVVKINSFAYLIKLRSCHSEMSSLVI